LPQKTNAEEAIMAQTRYFALRTSEKGKESAVFTGSAPRQAALKAASRGHNDIYLRERGSKKLHRFRGSRRKVRAPENKPEWMADTVWKPNVRKLGIIKMEKPKAKRAAKKRTAKRRTAKRTTKRKATKKKAVKRKPARKTAAKKKPAKRKTAAKKKPARKAAKKKPARRATARRRR